MDVYVYFYNFLPLFLLHKINVCSKIPELKKKKIKNYNSKNIRLYKQKNR